MKIKRLSIAIIFLAVALIAYIAASLLCCYTTKPAVTSGEFSFAITYEYKGETKTLSGVLKCEYSGSNTIFGEHSRYWDQNIVYDNPENLEFPFVIDQNEEAQTTLSLHENMSAGYFMGDPLEAGYYEESEIGSLRPYASYYDYANGVFLEDATEDVLDSIGFKVVDFTYAEPIENSFSFSGLRYEADNVFLFVFIALVFLILCIIFVRKEKDLKYSVLDKIGIALNFPIGIVVIPILYVICTLFGIVESGVEIVDQIIYNIPPIAIACLALSIVFRRKGFSKTGFFIQFGGAVPIVAAFIFSLIFS